VNLGCNIKMVEKDTFVAITYPFTSFFLCNEKSHNLSNERNMSSRALEGGFVGSG